MRISANHHWKEYFGQCKKLIRSANWSAFGKSFPMVLRLARTTQHHQDFLKVILPHQHHFLNPSNQLIYAELLLCARAFSQALDFINPLMPNPDAQSLYALALLRNQQPVEALNQAKAALKVGTRLDLAYRVIAEASFEMRLPKWQKAFEQAVDHTKGRQCGYVYIEWGRALELELQGAAARECWAIAKGIFHQDAFYEAQIMANMGLSCAKELKLEEAETHYAQLLKRAAHPEAQMFQSQAWRGFGLSWRAAGEYQRALFAYQKALLLAKEPFDKIQAQRGIGHTLRLQGYPSQALLPLRKALAIQQKHHLPLTIYPDLAAARLADGNLEAALDALEQWQGTGEDEERRQIVLAEIARQHQNPNLALEHAQKVRWNSLWGRDELIAFPKLQAFLIGMNMTLPNLPPSQIAFHVEVKARGTLQVRMNKRHINLNPTSRAAQLLVLLLEHGGSCSARQLLESLYPNTSKTEARSKQQLVSKAVVALRESLGWQDSVIQKGGVYTLDPNSTWDYDVQQARDKGETVSVFMTGVDEEWVLERIRSFEHQPRDLN
jgi:tetratricopeptide (TPR) repeat protein